MVSPSQLAAAQGFLGGRNDSNVLDPTGVAPVAAAQEATAAATQEIARVLLVMRMILLGIADLFACY